MRALAGLLVLVGCADPGLPFDVDVVVRDSGHVQVWLREGFATACTPEETFPRPGECTSYTDVFGCDTAAMPDFCVDRAALVRGAAVLAEAPFLDRWWHRLGLLAPTLFDAPGAELVIDLCDGDSLRVPLPAAPGPALELTDLAVADNALNAEWNGDLRDVGAIAHLSYAYGGEACHDSRRGVTSLPDAFTGPVGFALFGVEPVTPTDTTRGLAYVWPLGPGAGADVAIPESPDADGWWPVWMEMQARLEGDGLTSTPEAMFLHVRNTAAGVRLRFESWNIFYEAGEATDTLAVTISGARYSATFPHVVPADDLDFVFDGNLVLDLTIGPVVVTSEVDPARSETVTFTVHADHRVIPRLPAP